MNLGIKVTNVSWSVFWPNRLSEAKNDNEVDPRIGTECQNSTPKSKGWVALGFH
jgi:hypothetical protein